MDYNKEKNNLKTGFETRNWWKPKAGQYKVKFLSEGEEYSYDFKEDDGKIKTVHKVRYDIQVGDEEFAWGITKGETEGSLFGQLVLVGANRNGLKDSNIDLLVKGAGKSTNYTVVDALALMTPKEEVVEPEISEESVVE